MKIQSIASVLLVILILSSSCTVSFESSTDLSGITNIYTGQYKISTSSEINTKEGKKTLNKLTVEDNRYINEGLIEDQLLSNNCAIILGKLNSHIFSNNENVEVVIKHKDNHSSSYTYTGSDLSKLSEKHIKLEKFIGQFVDSVIVNSLDTTCIRIPHLEKGRISDYIDGFRAKIPKGLDRVKITGFAKYMTKIGNIL